MYKSLSILVFLMCFGVKAQDSAVANQPKIIWTQKYITIANDSVPQRHFQANFQQKYKISEFSYTEKPLEKTIWERFVEWLSNTLGRLFNLGGDKASNVTDLVLKIIAIIVVVVVIYLIAKAILNKEGQWIFGRSSAKKIIKVDDIEKNLQAVNFEKLVADTIASGNQRLAVRYYYLWLLKKFSERSIITWDIEKTNSDYLYEIRNEQYKAEFAYLSYLYNYIWYGEFEIDEAIFKKAAHAFTKTIRSL